MKYILVISDDGWEALAYPNYKGQPTNSHVIGSYTPTNPRVNLQEYKAELLAEIRRSLGTVIPKRIIVRPLDGSPQVTLDG